MVKKTEAQICYVWDSSQVTQMVKDKIGIPNQVQLQSDTMAEAEDRGRLSHVLDVL